jgi:predicted DNA-binding transcriptional regulator YafY
MDQPKYERMVSLMLLLAGNHCYTVKQIARKFDVSDTTIYRYIDTFREGGMVITEYEDIYRIDGRSPFFRDISELVHFTLPEAHVLKSVLDGLDDTNVLKQFLKTKLFAGHNFKLLADIVVIHKDARNVNRLVEAISLHKQVKLCNYASAHSNSVRDRLVEPFQVETNYIQVWCYEPESGQNKLFKLARIGEVEVKEDDWQYENEHKAGFTDIFRIHGHNKRQVQLKLDTRAAHLLMEEYPLASTYMRPLDEKGCLWLLDTPVCSLEGVGRFVMGLINEIEVIGPKELKFFLKHRMKEGMDHLKTKSFI